MNETFEVGQPVCIKGQGGDAMAHRHGKVERITKTQIVVAVKLTTGVYVERFRVDQGNRSIPYSAYGGTQVFSTCQKKKAR